VQTKPFMMYILREQNVTKKIETQGVAYDLYINSKKYD
jgi:hypothetical protein